MDSYATRVLDGIAGMLRLRGAETVVVGIQPGVAFAMSQLGLRLESAGTALDLDDGLEEIERRIHHGR
jgi:rsbT antagonist protein RsbS